MASRALLVFFSFFFLILRRMGKNKDLTSHTYLYLLLRLCDYTVLLYLVPSIDLYVTPCRPGRRLI